MSLIGIGCLQMEYRVKKVKKMSLIMNIVEFYDKMCWWFSINV